MCVCVCERERDSGGAKDRERLGGASRLENPTAHVLLFDPEPYRGIAFHLRQGKSFQGVTTQGYLADRKLPPPRTVGLRPGPYKSPRGGGRF